MLWDGASGMVRVRVKVRDRVGVRDSGLARVKVKVGVRIMVGVRISGMFRARLGINNSKDNVKDGNRNGSCLV